MAMQPQPTKKLDPRQLRCIATQNAFLKVFERLGSVGASCLETGVSVHTYDLWIHEDTQGFKTRRDAAATLAMGVLEREILRRAVEGNEKDIYYKGNIVGKERQYSDNLLMFRAKKLDPSYKDNWTQPDAKPQTVQQINIHLHPSVSSNPSPQTIITTNIVDALPPVAETDSDVGQSF